MKMHSIRVIVTLVLMVLATGAFAQSVNWVTIEEAQELNKKEPRKFMIDVYTKWCGPCKMMNKHTFHDEQTVKYINEHYYAIKFNAEGPDSCVFKSTVFKNPKYIKDKPGRNGTHQFTRAIAPVNGRIAYPTLVFIDQDLNLITPVQGYQKPEQLEPMLKFIVEEQYITSDWQTFMKTFKSERTTSFPGQ